MIFDPLKSFSKARRGEDKTPLKMMQLVEVAAGGLTMRAYPDNPSVEYSLGRPSLKPFAQPGCVWTLTYTSF